MNPNKNSVMPVTKVVILNWNGKHHLERFLPSVVQHTPTGIGIVVADNGSTDYSLEYLRAEYPGVELIALERNYGFAKGYNMALQSLEADYYILLNSDVEVTERWAEPLVELAEADSSIAAVSPKLLAYDDKYRFEYAGAAGGFIDMLGYPFCRGRILSTLENDKGQYDCRREIFWASGACMLVRSSAFHAAGGFDGDFFAHMEEIDLCWRLQLYGYRIISEPASRVYHLGGGTLSSTSDYKLYLNYRNNLAMLLKNLPRYRGGAVVFLRMVLDGFSAFVYLLQGKKGSFRAVWKAHRDFRKWKPELLRKRSEILMRKRAKSKSIYKGSIILRYVLGRKKFGNMM